MIGREDPVRPFELIRWARDQAVVHSLKPVEAHVLLVLATYANEEAKAWPSIRTIAGNCGLRATGDGRCSSVSAALQRLQDHKLVWTTQGGHGRPATRELLFNPQPSAVTDGTWAEPFVVTDGSGGQPSVLTDTAFRPDGPEPSVLTDQNYQRNCGENDQENGQAERPDEAFRSGGRLPSPPRGRKKKGRRGGALRPPSFTTAIGGEQ